MTSPALKRSLEVIGYSVFGGLIGFQGAKGWQHVKNLRESSEEPATVDPKIDRGKEILKYGSPVSLVPDVQYYSNHVLAYDPVKKTPKWVAEHITKDHVSKSVANRRKSKFKQDECLLRDVQSDNDDFWDSGWSRGHMAPAGDNKHCQTAMNETFLLSNIVPQNISNNGDFWNRMETYCRDLTDKYSDVRVISGPMWLPHEHELVWMPSSDGESPGTYHVIKDGKPSREEAKMKPLRFMTYPVIGKNLVAVPSHLFKIVLVEDPSLEKPLIASFVVPNVAIGKEKLLTDFKVPVEKVEQSVGYRFHAGLDRSRIGDLCEVDGCKMRTYKEFQRVFIERGIRNARSEKELKKQWKRAQKLEVTDASLTALYQDQAQKFAPPKAENKDPDGDDVRAVDAA